MPKGKKDSAVETVTTEGRKSKPQVSTPAYIAAYLVATSMTQLAKSLGMSYNNALQRKKKIVAVLKESGRSLPELPRGKGGRALNVEDVAAALDKMVAEKAEREAAAAPPAAE